jgi:FkbM family methyltransferase
MSERWTGPIHAGMSRALVKLRTGEYLCVDTDSIDSIDYLLGREMEVNVMPVFRRFLEPRSVVLDIGANYGLYTVTSASVTKGHGRIYAFEGNPHTFNYLRRSVYANQLRVGSDVVLVNRLIGDRCGKHPFYFSPNALGGGTLTYALDWEWEGDWKVLELDMVTIDEFLPANLEVDLVKIDVEGHEPTVLRGMERTIARSHNIRILIEWFPNLLELAAVDQLAFMDYIHGLGLNVCRIDEKANLQVIGRDEIPPREPIYCWLTRTPEEDARRRSFSIAIERLSVKPSYARLIRDGNLIFSADEQLGDEDETLFYGPYIHLASGRYAFRFIGELAGELTIRLTRDFGVEIATVAVRDFAQPLVILIPEDADKFEIVGLRSDALRRLTLRAIDVEQTV